MKMEEIENFNDGLGTKGKVDDKLKDIFEKVPRKRRTASILISTEDRQGADGEFLPLSAAFVTRKRSQESRKRRASMKHLQPLHPQSPPPPPSSNLDPNFAEINHCPTCDIYFRRDSTYELHQWTQHRNRKPRFCRYCERFFSDKHSLYHHVEVRHADRENFVLTVIKRNKPFSCPLCGTRHVGVRNFENHAHSLHPGAKLIPCSYCREKAYDRYELNKHENIHWAPYLRCGICKADFDRSDVKQRHEVYCEKTWAMRRIGSNKIDVTELEEPPNLPKYCDLCTVAFNTYSAYRKHSATAHPGGNKAFPCDLCHKSYTTNTYLEEHTNKWHAKDKAGGGRPFVKYKRTLVYTCEHCHADIVGVKAYEKHGLNLHPGRGMFRCGQCCAGFSRKGNLNRHLKSYHKGGDLTCSRCERTFSRKDTLSIHEKSCGNPPDIMK